MSGFEPIIGEVRAVPSRGLTIETCSKWGYTIGAMGGEPVQIANYRDPISGQIVAQKTRTRDKDFKFLGDTKKAGLYGRHLWRDAGRRVIITEGELDAMSVSQVLEHRWQVVSLPNGSSGARKSLAEALDWLNQFEQVVLCFDMDEPGRKAVADCATLFPPGKLYVVSLPLKDANAMLVEKRTEELVKALWDAKAYRPDGLVRVSDVKEKALTAPTADMAWCLPTLNDATYGRRFGEAVALGAGTGIGKTTLITQQIADDINEGHKVAIFAFEQDPAETVKRVAGQMFGRIFHVPGEFKQAELERAIDELDRRDALHLYDHFGACEWGVVKERIRYLRHAHDVRIFYLDHLTALAAAEEDERKALEKIMAEVGSLVKELGIWLLFVSHLATPDGTPHEEGGRVTIKHFKGSRAIGYWSHFMIGLERDQQSDDAAERSRTILRVLKDRYTGRATGLTIALDYSQTTGLLHEGSRDEDTPFTDATTEDF